MYQFPQKYEAAQLFPKLIMHFSRADQHIRVIFERPCETGVMMFKIQLYITEINYILQYIKIENSYLKL